MAISTGVGEFSPREERLNVLSHGFGTLLSLVGLVFLILRAVEDGSAFKVATFSTFGISIVLLFAASTLYHASQDIPRRTKYQILDHAAIFLLIAGTYTPFSLHLLPEGLGWTIFGVQWAMAGTGIVLKLFFTGRFVLLSTIVYLIMGWMIILAIGPLSENLSREGLMWTFAGGAAYTIGAVCFLIERLPYNHALFHLLVLIGCFCHYWTVYCFIV